jgi:cytochrome b6-f complex iron-sulfur subunit
MDRKDFFVRVGFGVAALLIPACIACLATSCNDNKVNIFSVLTGANFKTNVTTRALTTNENPQLINSIAVVD